MKHRMTNSPGQFRAQTSNYYAVLIDGMFFFTAMAFIAPATVIPTFAKELGASPWIIGLAPTLYNLGWMLPQLFSARYVQRLSRKKPYVLTMSGTQRLLYVVIAASIWLVPIDRAKLLLTAFLSCYLVSSIFDGIGTPAWMELVASSVPERQRGSLFAARSFLSCIGGLAAGWLTSLTLNRFPFPSNFGFLFFWAFLLLAAGWAVFAYLTFELPAERESQPVTGLGDYLRQIPGILANDRYFFRYVIGVMIMLMGQVGIAFLSVHQLERLTLPAAYVGYFTISMTGGQMLASLFAGRLADAKGHKLNLLLSCAAMGLAAFSALLPASLALAIVSFAFVGISNTAYSVSRLPIVMEFAPEGFRSVYAGIINTFLAPVVVLTPVLGGWLVDNFGYGTVFYAALLLNAAAVGVFTFWIRDPRDIKASGTGFSQTL
ncbi:MAG: MFS transporter [Firmicutes bacterium]|nr:MFS transporter [Bacillota bacterium]